MNFEECDGILVVSCCDYSPVNVIQHILDVTSEPDSICRNNISCYPWKMDTKYYTADVLLYPIKTHKEYEHVPAETVRAVVFYFDSKKPHSFEKVVKWLPILKEVDIEIQLVICDRLSSALHHKVTDWCIENQFELVEVNPSSRSDCDEDALVDAIGYKRVVQALHSHMWANLVMKKNMCPVEGPVKTKVSSVIPELKSQAEGGASASNSLSISKKPSAKEKSSKASLLEKQTLELEEDVKNIANGDEDPGGESFEELFARFANMKEKASGLEGEARKKYAEEVVIAFWRAVGGDEEEIAGLDDDDDFKNESSVQS